MTVARNSQVVHKDRDILSTVGLGEQAEIAVVVVGERMVEGLEEAPYVRLGRLGRVYVKIASTVADVKGLVEVKHVGDIVPTVLVRREATRGLVFEEARTILLEKTEHAAATGATIEPECHRRGRRTFAGLEEPPEEGLRRYQQ